MQMEHAALARRDGDRLVLRRAIALPDACLKCGAAATSRRERAFWFAAPWMYALLLLGPFGALGLLWLTKTAALAVPLCAACDARWNAAALARKVVTVAAIASTLVAIFWPLLVPGFVAVLLAIAVTLAGLAAIVTSYLATRARVLHATSIDATALTLSGAAPAAVERACRDAIEAPALDARTTTRLAARLLVAHLLAYTLALTWAVAAIPIVVQSLPPNLGDDVQAIGAIVLRKVLWPFVGVWVLVHLVALPWALTKSDARVKWTRAGFLVAVALVLGSALVAGGRSWWRLFHA
jgi:hypothetical protein